MKIKVCLHNHTFQSQNSINTLEDFKSAFDEGRIDKVAITDHDFIQQAREFQNYFGENRIIVGEEITSKDGDILGLFLKKFVTSGLSGERVIELIKAQGGIVYIPHPFSRKGVGKEFLDKHKKNIDVIEAYNGWTHRTLMRPFQSENANKLGEEWGRENDMPMVSSSDSHFRTDIGSCHTIMEDFDSPESFIDSLRGETELVKRKNKVNMLAWRAWFKGKFRRDILSFIK